MTPQHFASSALIDLFDRGLQRADDRRRARVESAAAASAHRTASTAQISRSPRWSLDLERIGRWSQRTHVAH